MTDTPDDFTVITPDSRFNEKSIFALRHLMLEVWSFRSHIRIVFKEQFKAAYYGTAAGVVWNFLLPIIPLTVYWLLSRIRVFPDFDGVDSATFLTFGVTLWFFLSGLILSPIHVLQSRNKESMKTAFPLSASIVSGYANMFFETSVRLVFVTLVVVITGNWPVWEAIFLPLLLLPSILIFSSIGLILGILNVIYRDISRVVTIALQYGIFISGVLFPMSNILLKKFNQFNPFSVFIDACRGLVFGGGIPNISVLLVMSFLGLIIFLVACRVFYVMEYRVRGIE